MVSFQSVREVTGPGDDPQNMERNRRRHDWVRGDVRCLMCARLVGRLLGSRKRERSSSGPLSFFAYRSAGTSQPVVAFTPGMRFTCADCGGVGALDELDFFSTYDEPTSAPTDEPVRRGPGRPPRQMKPPASPQMGVTLALTALAELGS